MVFNFLKISFSLSLVLFLSSQLIACGGSSEDKQALISSVTISSPKNTAIFSSGENITFIASVKDNNGKDISSGIEWASDIQGTIGKGGEFSTVLEAGEHKITASIDVAGKIVSGTVNLTVNPKNGHATLSWNQPTTNTDNTPLTDLAGYKIYYGNTSDNLSESITVNDSSAVNWLIENLHSGRSYFFALTAFNSKGVESDLSNIVKKDI